MKKWVKRKRDQSNDDEELTNVACDCQWSKWLPWSPNLLFGGHRETDIDEQLRRAQ